MIGALRKAVNCVQLPVQFIPEAPTEEDSILQLCPKLVTEKGQSLEVSCSCCDDGISTVLQGKDVDASGVFPRIADCVCFKAGNLACGDVFSPEEQTSVASIFHNLVLASLALNLVVVVLTAATLLCSTTSILISVEKFLETKAIKSLKQYKKRKIKQLKKFLSHRRIALAQGASPKKNIH